MSSLAQSPRPTRLHACLLACLLARTESKIRITCNIKTSWCRSSPILKITKRGGCVGSGVANAKKSGTVFEPSTRHRSTTKPAHSKRGSSGNRHGREKMASFSRSSRLKTAVFSSPDALPSDLTWSAMSVSTATSSTWRTSSARTLLGAARRYASIKSPNRVETVGSYISDCTSK